jgi:membrane protease YdiL (CAAX protease family)
MEQCVDAYLDLARQGKNQWWRFVLAVLLILFLWLIVGAIPTALLTLWSTYDGNPATNVSPQGASGLGVLPDFVALMLASICLLLGTYLAVRFIHGRRPLTLITPSRSASLSRFGQGFLAWFVLCAAIALAEALTHPGRYVLNLDLPRYLPFAFLALALVPLQTSAEELFFRGYLLQGFGLRLRNPWVLSVISGLVFGLPHLLNPEARASYLLMGLSYVSFGAVLAYVTLRDGRLELALGMHAANNLFAALLANYTGSALPTPALFTINTLDVTFLVLTLLPALLLFVLIFFGRGHRGATGG